MSARGLAGCLVVCVAAALLLTGCVQVKSVTLVEKDLSGVQNMKIGLMKAAIDEVTKDNQGEDPFKGIKSQAAGIPGATAKDYTEGDYVGVEITIPFKSLDELRAYRIKSDDGKPLDAMSWSAEGDVCTLAFDVNVADIVPGDPEDTAPAPSEEAMPAPVPSGQAYIQYAIGVPGRIVKYSPDKGATVEPDGSGVTWNLDPAGAAVQTVSITWDNAKAPEIKDALQKYIRWVESGGESEDGDGLAEDATVDSPVAISELSIPGMTVAYGNSGRTANGLGVAEWTATYGEGGAETLQGVDVFWFGAEGDIIRVKGYVDPEACAAAAKGGGSGGAGGWGGLK